MEEVYTYLKQAVDGGYSDLFIAAGKAVSGKKDGEIVAMGAQVLAPEQTAKLVQELYGMAERPVDAYLTRGDDDFSVSVPGMARFRVSAYRQRGTMAAAIRVVHFGIPDRKRLGIPKAVMGLADLTSGLALVTGPAGSGRSTTLACIVDAINHRRDAHIITIEDPIEYLHRDDKSYITQRELAVAPSMAASPLAAPVAEPEAPTLFASVQQWCDTAVRQFLQLFGL